MRWILFALIGAVVSLALSGAGVFYTEWAWWVAMPAICIPLNLFAVAICEHWGL